MPIRELNGFSVLPSNLPLPSISASNTNSTIFGLDGGHCRSMLDVLVIDLA